MGANDNNRRENCGVEGPDQRPAIEGAARRQKAQLIATLLPVSKGVAE